MSVLDESKRIYILEGMDMVGKTTFAKTSMPGYRIYHADHDLVDRAAGRNYSWIIGYGVLDFLRQTGPLSEKIVIDRGVFSSYVYPKLYEEPEVLSQSVTTWYENDEFFNEEVGHIYVCHSSEESARQIYEESRHRPENPNVLSAAYDTFESFDQYWSTYLRAHELFGEIYGKMWIRPVVVKSVYCKEGPTFEVKK